MTPSKTPLGVDVRTAAEARIARVFDDFERVYVSFSAGKDSSVMLHLVAAEARRRGRRFGVLLVDLEAQYALTIAHAEEVRCDVADVADFDWVALPLILRNAVSQFEPRWLCWDPSRRADWVREPPAHARTDEASLPWFRRGMEFEDFVPAYGEWYAGGTKAACFVGIRADESLNRYRTIKRADKGMHEGLPWTTLVGEHTVNCYPIYDWRTEDIWTFNGKTGCSYNRLYDRMHQAGLSIHEQRICQPYGDDQRKGLWLYQVIEPQTWGRVVARVNGANQGALYARERGNILGRIKVTKPEGHTWHSFSRMLLDTMPPKLRAHYEAKILVFLKWYADRGQQEIPDAVDPKLEAARESPSWRRVCKSLLRNDYWCKGLSFTQTAPDAYDRYLKLAERRKGEWGLTI
jgi:predicted phosphoadenosine phosphosulfate sulfurtransferase